MAYSILISEPMAEEGLLVLNAQADLLVDFEPSITRARLLEIIPRYDALLVRSQTKVDQELIGKGANLKLVGRAGVGLDNIDKACAERQKINVINTPLGNSIATAELTFALMLGLARPTHQASFELKQGQWNRGIHIGTELYGKTLGIIGFGNVGRLVSDRAQAFGMQVQAYDPFAPSELFSGQNVKKVSLNEIFASSDYLTLHCQLTQETRHLINRAIIKLMKKGLRLINAARGELIDNEALLDGLNSGQIDKAALDVFAVEPPPSNDTVICHPRILATPHLGASTKEAQLKVSTMLAEQVCVFFKTLG